MYRKFYYDINKVSVFSSELLDDLEIIKDIWLRLDHRICLTKTIIYYYCYVYLKYYTGTIPERSSGASSQTISSNTANINVNGHSINLKEYLDFLVKKKIFGKIINSTESDSSDSDESSSEEQGAARVSSSRPRVSVNTLEVVDRGTEFRITLDNYYSTKDLPDNEEPILNLFLDPLSLCLINLNISNEEPFIMLNWIKIMTMTLNDCYNTEIIPFKKLTIKPYNKSEHELLSYKKINSDKQINIFHRYYVETEITQSTIANKLLNFTYKDYVNNSSNFYGMCIDSDFNNINSFFSLMKSNSYENIFNIFPFVKYGYITNPALRIDNTVIEYIKYDESSGPDSIVNYQIGSYDSADNPNCLNNNLVSFISSTIDYLKIFNDYIEKIRTIEKKNAQVIFQTCRTKNKYRIII